MKIHNIYWDTDGDGEALASLPKEVELPSRFDQPRFIKPTYKKGDIKMGKGNVCVSGPYEGLFYIDNDYTTVLRREDDCEDTILQKNLSAKEVSSGDWLFDDEGSSNETEDVLECFMENFTRRYPSFERVKKDKWLGRNIRVILESELFYIGVEDNDWSMAVELLQKDDSNKAGLQKMHYSAYLDGMKAALLERLPSIGTYAGPWTHGTIRREPMKDDDLLTEAGDRIDNAVFDFICAVVTGHSINGEEPKEALLAAVNELSVEHINVLPTGLLSDATKEAREAVGEHSLQEDADDGLPLRWDMAAIGDISSYLEGTMASRFNINSCHPWQDDTECICYATDERCHYCGHTV